MRNLKQKVPGEKGLQEQFELMLPLRGRWLRYFLTAAWLLVGSVLVLLGSALVNPPDPRLWILFALGVYICVRTAIYACIDK
jgi:hypothetical protein